MDRNQEAKWQMDGKRENFLENRTKENKIRKREEGKKFKSITENSNYSNDQKFISSDLEAYFCIVLSPIVWKGKHPLWFDRSTVCFWFRSTVWFDRSTVCFGLIALLFALGLNLLFLSQKDCLEQMTGDSLFILDPAFGTIQSKLCRHQRPTSTVEIEYTFLRWST
ncbi:hypothetical protein CEXT_74651 [Caerostris extrusa]|uniref:Uncharacterized protein n=1 Tax=Caerostris extrusa TaxID=172846 RepID=A0AAV4T7L0_CAEEX|nr:hypothetical protein CEXT_74651 [Caerostris extrusa]